MEIRDISGQYNDRGIKKSKKEVEADPQTGQDRVEIDGNPDRGCAVTTRFAIDKDNNRKIDEGEIIKDLSELKGKDRDGDDTLKKGELKGVFFEYSKDKWLAADKINKETIMCEGQVPLGEGTIEVKEIDVKTGQMKMKFDMHMRMPDYLSDYPQLKNFPGC